MRAREQAGQPDVYQYDDLPKAFRTQVVFIWQDALGLPAPRGVHNNSDDYWESIHDTLARELGLFELSVIKTEKAFGKCKEFLLSARVNDALDLIELTFRFMTSASMSAHHVRKISAFQAISELNNRFKEHAIGYRFESGEIIRIDSEYLHTEAVKPAIQLLSAPGFVGPSQEFLRAHEHYRHRRNKEAIADALKAFESTIKAICDRRRWAYKQTAAAKELIQVVFDHGLLPTPLQSQFTALRSVLESGLPTVRNKMGGHGQGATPVDVPDYLAAYALHLAGSNIQLLAEADKALA
jgi:hypothetical protein